jgi:hypothetical protein
VSDVAGPELVADLRSLRVGPEVGVEPGELIARRRRRVESPS